MVGEDPVGSKCACGDRVAISHMLVRLSSFKANDSRSHLESRDLARETDDLSWKNVIRTNRLPWHLALPAAAGP